MYQTTTIVVNLEQPDSDKGCVVVVSELGKDSIVGIIDKCLVVYEHWNEVSDNEIKKMLVM